ncbi:hypothetical protein [Magnetospirillum sp. LM-5]|uniref:hypothetical protein n=1 Tax=Magnetospirillum sp. LM-5 TaxID=2681466 RepID=UPI00156EAD50|nr:hypothetical protein [Magnetospirillum sp. LM-5]
MRDIRFAPGIKDTLGLALTPLDLQVIVTTMLDVAKNGEKKRAGVTFAAVDGLGFPCREAAISQGRKGIGLLTVYSLAVAEDVVVVLYAKEGAAGNLSLQERNKIREAYQAEMERH